MTQDTLAAGFGKTLNLEFDAARERVEQSLAEEGFGVLSRIDVSGTLRKKLGVDHPRTEILGACNPACAHEALTLAPDVSLMLPCNVVLRDGGDGTTRVEVINARSMAVFFPGIEQVAERVAVRLDRVLAAL